jgi:hypothetical protein
MSGGLKNDQGKPRMELLDSYALEQVSKVLAFGADKYTKNGVRGEHNWRKGIAFSRLIGAVFRHLYAWLRGESTDPETGLSHLAHAGCGIMFLLWHEKHRPDLDDRYQPEQSKAYTDVKFTIKNDGGSDDKSSVESAREAIARDLKLQDPAEVEQEYYGGGRIMCQGSGSILDHLK